MPDVDYKTVAERLNFELAKVSGVVCAVYGRASCCNDIVSIEFRNRHIRVRECFIASWQMFLNIVPHTAGKG